MACFWISIRAQSSPCPGVLSYAPKNETDRWYATLTLTSDETLRGIRLEITLDTKAQLFGNWFKSIQTNDNTVFTIQDWGYALKAGEPVEMRFFVKYLITDEIPAVKSVILNGKTICSTTGHSEEDLANSSGSRPVTTTTTTQPPPPRINITPQSIDRRTSSSRPTLIAGEITSDSCGTVVKRPNFLVTHGKKTSEGEYPWHGAIYYVEKTDPVYKCGSSLISARFVITAAHCVTIEKTEAPINKQDLLIYFGKYSLRKWISAGIQEMQVDRVIVHDGYNVTSFQNDIALLKLVIPARLTDWVRPVCLWSGLDNIEQILNREGIVVGWGYTERNVLSDELLQTNMPVVSKITCIYSYPEFFSRFTSDSSFCAGYKNGSSVCNGDSGGGMVFPIEGTNPVRYQIRGIVSLSVAGQGNVCDPNNYSVFTDIAKFKEWVNSYVSSTN